ncbi:MAG TPA: hypothetical protein DCE13_03910, partial [Cryomorphaceae bacterium]|nr:hypothetical protein [Cryomorphaceae bacterium]
FVSVCWPKARMEAKQKSNTKPKRDLAMGVKNIDIFFKKCQDRKGVVYMGLMACISFQLVGQGVSY